MLRLPARDWPAPAVSRHALLLLALVIGAVDLVWSVLPWGPSGTARASPLAQAPRTYEAEPDPGSAPPGVDRYTVQVRPGSTLWDIATEALPGVVLEEGNARALELVEASFRQAFPDRAANLVRLGDTFALDVPAGTFMTASVMSPDRGRTIEYTSFAGDNLSEYTTDPALVYRWVRAADPSRARVMLRAGSSVPSVEIARRVYQTDAPDFLQVRWVRGALSEAPPVMEVNLQRPYLDQFRNFRGQAAAVEPGEEGMQTYIFDPADESVPFLVVEDAIGDEWDPANFPRIARREFYRDGSVKRYILTQPGDLLSVLVKPDNKRWASLAPAWSSWTDGEVQRLQPFAPAVNELGSLLPGRLLVLQHEPKPNAGKGAECLGIPVGLALTAGLARQWWRRRRPDDTAA
jgi:hypothetical protein